MSDIDLVINYCDKISSLLVDKLGAKGHDLKQKVDAAKPKLPDAINQDLEALVEEKARAIHEATFKLESKSAFVSRYDDCVEFLKKLNDLSDTVKAVHKQLNQMLAKLEIPLSYHVKMASLRLLLIIPLALIWFFGSIGFYFLLFSPLNPFLYLFIVGTLGTASWPLLLKAFRARKYRGEKANPFDLTIGSPGARAAVEPLKNRTLVDSCSLTAPLFRAIPVISGWRISKRSIFLSMMPMNSVVY